MSFDRIQFLNDQVGYAQSKIYINELYKTEDGGKLFRPIPRDRDNAFNQYNGLIMKLGKNLKGMCK